MTPDPATSAVANENVAVNAAVVCQDAPAPVTTDLHKLATGSTLAFGGTIIGNGLTYLFGIVIARSLGAGAVGLYFLALAVMQLVGAGARLGLGDGLLRYLAIPAAQNRIDRVKGTILFALAAAAAASTFASVLLLASATPLSVVILKQPDLVPYLRGIAVTLPFFTILMVLLNSTQALQRVDLVVLSRDVVQPIAMIGGGLLLFEFSRTPAAFLTGYFCSMVLACGTAAYLMFRACPGLRGSDGATFDGCKALMLFSLPIAGGDLVHYVFRGADTFLLSYFRSAAEVGIYSAALRTTLLLNLLAAAVTSLYAPLIAEHHHHGRHRQIQVLLRTLMRWCLTLAMPVVLVMCLLANEILSLWGSHFGDASTVLMILAVSQLLALASTLLAFTLLMCDRQYLEVSNVIAVTAVNIVANIALIPRHGTTGAAAAMLLSQALILAVRFFEVRHLIGVRLFSTQYLKPLLAVGAASLIGIVLQLALLPATGTSSALHLGSIFLVVALTGAGYLAALYLLGLEEDDLSVWTQVRRTTARL